MSDGQVVTSHLPETSPPSVGEGQGGGTRTATWTPIARSPVHHLHRQLGASFRRAGAFEVPAGYGDPEAERRAIREGLALADVSARSKIDLRGAVDAAQARLQTGPDVLCARLSGEWALLLGGPEGGAALVEAARTALDGGGIAWDATSVYAAFALAGPRVLDLLARLTAFDAASLPAGTAAAARLAKIPAILLASSSSPWKRVELLVPSEYGRYAWEALLQAGHPLDARPVGWDALGEVFPSGGAPAGTS